MGQQAKLKLACQCQIMLEFLFLAGDSLIESCILDRDGDLRRQSCHDPHVIFVEVTAARVLDVKHANGLVFVDQGHAELGACLGIGHDVTRIFTNVGNQHGLPGLGGVTYQSLADGDLVLQVHAFLEAKREAMLQYAAGRVEQQNRKHLVIDYACHQIGYALQQLVDIEDGRELAADLRKQRELTRLPRYSRVEASILDASSDARGEQREQTLVLFGERARLRGFDVEYADDFVLRNERHGKLGAHVKSRVDEVLLGPDVVDQYCFAPLYSLTSNALSDLDADALGDFGRMAHLEAYAQLLCLFVEQQDGKNFVIDEALRHLRDTLQQRVQIKSGVHRIGNFQKVVVDVARCLLCCSSCHHPEDQPS